MRGSNWPSCLGKLSFPLNLVLYFYVSSSFNIIFEVFRAKVMSDSRLCQILLSRGFSSLILLFFLLIFSLILFCIVIVFSWNKRWQTMQLQHVSAPFYQSKKGSLIKFIIFSIYFDFFSFACNSMIITLDVCHFLWCSLNCITLLIFGNFLTSFY